MAKNWIAGAINPKKHLLRQFFGNCLVMHHPEQEANDGAVILADQVVVPGFVASSHRQHDLSVCTFRPGNPLFGGKIGHCHVRMDPGATLALPNTQPRIVNRQACHILWNTADGKMLRCIGRFLPVLNTRYGAGGRSGSGACHSVQLAGQGRLGRRSHWQKSQAHCTEKGRNKAGTGLNQKLYGKVYRSRSWFGCICRRKSVSAVLIRPYPDPGRCSWQR